MREPLKPVQVWKLSNLKKHQHKNSTSNTSISIRFQEGCQTVEFYKCHPFKSLWIFAPAVIKPLTLTHWVLWSTDRVTLEHVNPLNWAFSCSFVFLHRVFQASAEVNHHTTVCPLTETRALAAVSSDTMAAILDYCVFTKLVCPLPPSRSVTFPPALPSSPGKRGLSAAMAMKKGVQLEGDWRLTVAVETWPHTALCHKKIAKIKVLAWRMLHCHMLVQW